MVDSSKRMVTVQVQFEDAVLTLLRAEARVRMKPVSEIIRVAAGKWLVNHRCLKQEQLNDEGRLIPEELQRRARRRRVRKEAADEGNVTALYGDGTNAAE
jgi:hypothetical protein